MCSNDELGAFQTKRFKRFHLFIYLLENNIKKQQV